MSTLHPPNHRPGPPRHSALMLGLTACLGMACNHPAPSRPTGPGAGVLNREDNCIGVDSLATPKPPLPNEAPPAGCRTPGTCIGQLAPPWQAWDFQTRSCGFGEFYGMEQFTGHVILIANLSGWCGYCQRQATQLDKLRIELGRAGVLVHLAIVNDQSADNPEDRNKLVESCSIPLFQDHRDFGIWAANGGSKDDFYIYDQNGRLLEYLAHGQAQTNLSVDNNYQALKARLIQYANTAPQGAGAAPGPGSSSGTESGPQTTSGSTSTSLPGSASTFPNTQPTNGATTSTGSAT